MSVFKIPKNIKNVLFDMDGTLVDTEPIGPAVFESYFKSLGVEVAQADVSLFTKIWRREITTYNQNDWLRDYARMNGLSAGDEILEGFYDAYIAAILRAEPLPGAGVLLQKLHQRGVKIGLVTASKLSQAKAILEHNGWLDLFENIVTKDDDVAPKPSPEPYLLGLERLKAVADETLVFEDAYNGVTSAKKAGCFVVAVKTGTTGQDLSQADVIVSDLTEVKV